MAELRDDEEEGSRIEQFRALVELEPEDYLGHFGLATAYFEAGRFREAAEEFRATLSLKPDYSAAYRYLGQSLEKLGEAEEAREVFLKGIEVAQRNGDLQTKKEIEVFLRRLGKPAG
ncbi:MAG: tetratricopeptide repeat protein [Deltaproteobacteria bacterium]|nr:tetratricopeptide repeat protein [Deltaproteobacteria bacterium]MBI3076858.1 tetratricopeptide repeat protein [Deltaproteobacteria bacterium]